MQASLQASIARHDLLEWKLQALLVPTAMHNGQADLRSYLPRDGSRGKHTQRNVPHIGSPKLGSKACSPGAPGGPLGGCSGGVGMHMGVEGVRQGDPCQAAHCCIHLQPGISSGVDL